MSKFTSARVFNQFKKQTKEFSIVRGLEVGSRTGAAFGLGAGLALSASEYLSAKKNNIKPDFNEIVLTPLVLPAVGFFVGAGVGGAAVLAATAPVAVGLGAGVTATAYGFNKFK